MIGFDKVDIKALYYNNAINELYEELDSRNISLSNFRNDQVLVNEITDYLAKKNTKEKSDIEFFVALDFAVTFCPEDTQIYFVLKRGIQPRDVQIKTISDLKNIHEEDTLTDFSICSNDGLRQFQLKQYRDQLTTIKLLEFIDVRLKKYANSLGQVNLLILLQGNIDEKEFQTSNVDFNIVNHVLSQKGYNFKSQILIAYNEQNKQYIIKQVYPNLTTSSRAITPWFK